MPTSTTVASESEFATKTTKLLLQTGAVAPLSAIPANNYDFSFPTYTKKLEDLRRQVKRARRWARETGSGEDQERFRQMRHELGRQSAKVANEAHRERVEAATKSIDDFWKLSRWARNTTPRATHTPTLRAGDREYVTAGEKAEILRDVLFPPAPTADLADLVGYDYPAAVNAPLITSEEVMHAIQRSASYKAPGPDGIPNAALKKAIEIPNLLMFLTHLFNECLRLGYCASHFRESTTVILRKPGKSDYTIPKSYRPITLLSTLEKALESVLATRLSYLVEAHALLPDTHVGGRVGRSCDHALHLLLERVYESWRQDEHVATLLTLDVTGAFDHVAHERLAHCLRKRRIPEEMVRWILSFLRDRSTTLVLQEGPMGTHPVATGIPQGSPLSPILYLFYNADLIDELHAAAAGKALVTGYIDDISPGEAASSRDAWASRHASCFAPTKYGLMHMWKKGWSARRASRPPSGESITLQGVEVRPTSSLKYLGVMLDEHLTGESQIAQCRKRAAQLIAALRSIAGMTWGVSTLHLRRMWTAVLLPQISFACSAWYTQGAYGSKSFEDRANSAFRSMQRQVLQYIAGAFRTTAGPALEVCLFVPPAPIAIQRLAEEACLRIHASLLRFTLARRSDEGRRYGLVSPLKRLETHLKFKGIEVNRLELIRPFAVPPWWQPPETRIAPDKDTAIKEHDLILRGTPLYGPNSAIAYTDGSKTENGGVGASAVTSRGNATARLDDQDTVYAAELKGILLALSQIKDDLVRELVATSRAPARTMTIFTDNQAAIQACSHPRRSSGQQILRNIAIQIENLRLAAWRVRIHWIPGHMGVHGNERADILAKLAASTCGPAEAVILLSGCRTKLRERAAKRWKDEWTSNNSGAHLRALFPEPTKEIFAIHESLRRAASSVLIQMQTGKIGLPAYLATLPQWREQALGDNPLRNPSRCTCDQGTMNTQHILFSCPRFTELRHRILGLDREGRTEGGHGPWKEWLSEPSLAVKTVSFMMQTKLLGQFRSLPTTYRVTSKVDS
ncbi:reverse transcriptase [Penicillium sp. IBT 31633x]|nr:reverse transcriptase [Penicillium sp. IBT 31633x]